MESRVERKNKIGKICRKIIILLLVFTGFAVLFGFLQNRSETVVTARIAQPTYPTVSFLLDSHTADTLHGYASQMDIPSLRKDIVSTGGTHELTAVITAYKNKITALKYTVYDLSGSTVFETGSAELADNGDGTFGAKFQFDDSWRSEREAVLCLEAERGTENSVYFYTRVTRAASLTTADCVNFAYQFSSATRDASKSGWVQNYLESNSSGDNTTLQKVTMNSSIGQVMWGGLTLANASEPQCTVTETNSTFTSLVLSYTVDAGSSGSEQKYRIREFYRVRSSTSGFYLLNYVRTMNASLQDNSSFITAGGIDLGITDSNVSYIASSDGNLTTFAEDDALWLYNRSAASMQKIFTFRLESGSGEPTDTSECTIRPVYMSDGGDVSFVVTGYMSRGDYEGQTGAAVYYYSAAANSVTLKAFVPCSLGSERAEQELGGLLYYSQQQNAVYALLNSTFYRLDVSTGETETITDNISADQCAFSSDGRYVAWPSGSDRSASGTAEILDMESGATSTISVEGSSYIRPVGFIGGDFVYGAFRTEDAGQDGLGNRIDPMYRIYISDFSGTILKEYGEDGMYITSASAGRSTVEVKRAKQSRTGYTDEGTDYITSNSGDAGEVVSIVTYTDSVMEKEVRISFADGIKNTALSWSSPDYVVSADVPELDLNESVRTGRYYVYGTGRLCGIYGSAAAAVTAADSVSGVVINSSGRYVWERGNRDLVYSSGSTAAISIPDGGSALGACLQMILTKEGVSGDAQSDLNGGMSAAQVLSSELQCDVLNLSGLSLEQLCYIINQDTPVIAMTDGGAVLLTGYSKTGVTYIDPASGAETVLSYNDAAAVFAAGGNLFIGYIK